MAPAETPTDRFLVVSDDVEVRHAVLGCLADLAAPASETGPRAALARVHDEAVDLLIVDTETAAGMGWGLLELAHRLDDPPRVVALVDSLEPAVVARARRAGADAVLHRRLMVGPALRAAARLGGELIPAAVEV